MDHVWSAQVDRDPAIAAEIARLTSWRGDVIPVVAAAHQRRITLYNRRPKSETFDARWFGIPIGHRPLPDLRTTSPEQDHLNELGRAEWCHRLGLATGLGPRTGRRFVFLVYKRWLENRRAPNLYIDVFELGGDGRLERVRPSPIEFPFTPEDAFHSTGYYLWAGFYEPDPDNPDVPGPRLVIITQTYAHVEGPAKLTYFSTGAFESPGALADKSVWTVTQVGDGYGGYELDALLVGDEIHCIFRDPTYPVTFSFAPGDGVDASGAVEVRHAQYAPLVYARIRAGDGTLIDLESDLPGGEHPQLQSIEPLAYTADRMNEGSMVMESSSKLIDIRYEVAESRKRLFLKADGVWTATELMRFAEGDYVKSPLISESRWCPLDPMVFVPPRTENVLLVARPHSPVPAHVARLEWSDGRFEADVVHHNRDVEALVMTRIEGEPEEAPTEVDLSQFAVANINHETIPPFGTQPVPSGNAQIIQYVPFKVDRLQDADDEYSWSLRQAGHVFNGTGGDLAAERREGSVASFVFVHPADGGVRLTFDFEPRSVNPVSNPPAGIDPDAVQGVIAGPWRHVESAPIDGMPIPGVMPGGGWLRYSQPLDPHFYAVGHTHFSGLDDELHALYAAALSEVVGTLSDEEREVVIDVGDLLTQPEAEPVWNRLWDIWDRINAEVIETSELVEEIGDLTLDFSKFTITWLRRYRVIVRYNEAFRTQFRFRGRKTGQGRVEGRFNVRAKLPRVRLARWLNPLARTEVEVSLDYRRPYTPALLMSDRIFEDGWKERLDRGATHDTVALVAKPIGSTTVVADSTTRFSWTAGGHLAVVFLPAVVSLLVALGLGWLGAELIAAAAIPIVGYGVVVWMLEDRVPGHIVNSVDRDIAAHDFKPTLDGTGMARHSGEGIAEEIAYRVLSPSERDRAGSNRFRRGVWQMVYVTDDQFMVLPPS